MALTAEERRAAAAARRQKVLGRGDSRMAQVTGTLAKPSDISAEPAPSTATTTTAIPSTTKNTSDISDYNGGGITAARPVASTPATTTTTAGPLKGTAAGDKWSEYTNIKVTTTSTIKRKPVRVLTLSEKLTAAVTATASLRLLAAILQGILLFSAWNLASQSAPGTWTLSWQQRAFNKAWLHLKTSGFKGNLGPAIKSWKTVTTTKLIIALKQPQWAAFAAAAQQHPMSILFAVNIACILPTYIFLLLSKSSRLGSGSGGGSASSSDSSLLLWKLVSMVAPALQSQLAHALAIQKLLASIIDCAVVTVVTLGVCQLTQQQLLAMNTNF